MLTLVEFKEVIDNIKKQEEIDEKFSTALETVCDSWCIYGTKNKKYESLWTLFKQAMNDKYDLISWWLYEEVEHFIYVHKDKIYYDLTTVESLYDYLNEKLKSKPMTKKMLKELKEQEKKKC